MTRWQKKLRSKLEDMRHTLRNSYVHRLLGDRIFSRHIWKFDMDAVSKGLAAGLFIALTPTIPFQMLLATVAAMTFRINLPVALAACWVTNPLTALPVYWAELRVGRFALERSGMWDLLLPFFSLETQTSNLMAQSIYLWTGALIFSTAGALLGYLSVRLLWRSSHQLKLKIKERREQ